KSSKCAVSGGAGKSLQSTIEMDRLIDKLRITDERKLPEIVAENILAFDSAFWMRLAARTDLCESQDDKEDFEDLASSLMGMVDRVVRKTEEKIESATDVLKAILKPITNEDEEIVWPPKEPENIILMKQFDSKNDGIDCDCLVIRFPFRISMKLFFLNWRGTGISTNSQLIRIPKFKSQRIKQVNNPIVKVKSLKWITGFWCLPCRIDKAMAKGDEKESTMESCIASKLADIGDTDLGPEPLADLIDRSRAGKTSLMRAVKSSGIIRAAAFPCTAQLPEFMMECARSYHPSSRSVRDASGKTIIRLDAEFINYCLKIPVRKVVTSISIQDADSSNIGEQLRNVKRTFSFKMTSYLVYAAASQGVFSKLDRCGVLSKDPIFECYPQLTAPTDEKDFKVINDDFFYDFICRLDKDLKANRGYGLFWRTNKDAQVSE
ncbi:hypothetical protein KI387_036220, partial [Taxus chinensis]